MKILNYSNIKQIFGYILGREDFEHIAREYPDECGCDAVFVRLSGKIGIKCFHNKVVAQQSYYYSRILATMGLTPTAWELSSVTLYGFTVWYYLTEIAEKYNSEESDNDLDTGYEMAEHDTEMYRLTGFTNGDIHENNYGWLKGNFVCIDVGHIKYISYILYEGVLIEKEFYPKFS